MTANNAGLWLLLHSVEILLWKSLVVPLGSALENMVLFFIHRLKKKETENKTNKHSNKTRNCVDVLNRTCLLAFPILQSNSFYFLILPIAVQ